MTYRIGYLRDYMLRECRIARTITTTMATTTIKQSAPQMFPTNIDGHISIFVDDSLDNINVDQSRIDRGYAIKSDRTTAPPGDWEQNQQFVHGVDLRRVRNDTNSEFHDGHSGMDNNAIWCLRKEGESQAECLLRVFRSSAGVLRPSVLNHLLVFTVFLTYIHLVC